MHLILSALRRPLTVIYVRHEDRDRAIACRRGLAVVGREARDDERQQREVDADPADAGNDVQDQNGLAPPLWQPYGPVIEA